MRKNKKWSSLKIACVTTLVGAVLATGFAVGPVVYKDRLRQTQKENTYVINQKTIEQKLEEYASHDDTALRITGPVDGDYHAGYPLFTIIESDRELRAGESYSIEYVVEVDDSPFNPRYVTGSRTTKDNISGEWLVYDGNYTMVVGIVDSSGKTVAKSKPVEFEYTRPEMVNFGEGNRIFDEEDLHEIVNYGEVRPDENNPHYNREDKIDDDPMFYWMPGGNGTSWFIY